MPLSETALKVVARGINAVLQQDKEWLTELSTMQNTVIRIRVKGLELEFDILIGENGIDLRKADGAGRPGIAISGPPLSLLALLLSDNAQQTMQAGDIHIEGDMHLANRLSRLATSIDIDWEEWLSQRTGDIAAHQLGEWCRRLWAWRNHLHKELFAATGEYLQEEAAYLPTRVETEHFMDGVDSLREATDRLQARVTALERKRRQTI